MQKISDEEFINLVQKNKNKYYKIAYSYVKNPEDTLDVIQEATYKAYLHLKSLRNIEFFNTWYIRIIINTAISVLRSNKKYVELPEDTFVAEDYMDECKYDLFSALKKLDLKYQHIIILKFYESMTFKQIGIVLKKPESTIKTDYYKAMKILKGKLSNDEF